MIQNIFSFARIRAIVITLLASNFLHAQNIMRTDVHENCISIEFDRQMDTQPVGTSACQISPPIDGRWQWQNDSTLVFTTDYTFEDNTLYVVTALSEIKDAEGKELSPHSFYFVHHKRIRAIRGPVYREEVDVWDTEIDWARGLKIQTIKPVWTQKEHAPQYVLHFLGAREFYGPLRDWRGDLKLMCGYDTTGKHVALSVSRCGQEIWRKTVNWEQCFLANADNTVSYVAAVGQTREGRQLYVYDRTGRTLIKYALPGCDFLSFSPVGKYLAVGVSATDLYLFDIIEPKTLRRRKFDDSMRILAAAVSMDGEVVVLLESTIENVQRPERQHILALYDPSGTLVWQSSVRCDYGTIPSICFTQGGSYFLMYYDNKLRYYRIIRG